MVENISLMYNGVTVKGVLLDTKEEEYVIKLYSGYQIVVLKQDCQNVEILKRDDEKNKKINLENSGSSRTSRDSRDSTNSNLRIALFHTGGTIASKVDYTTGAVSSKFTPDELLALFSELDDRADIEAFMIGNLSSEDMRFGHYNVLLKEICEHLTKFDGIIISHGTDTMHYTASALQYSLENLNIPVILVGAQRSSDRGSSDAFSNLKAAIEFVRYNAELKKNSKVCFNRVGICMHSTINDDGFYILDAINAKKLHSSKRDAFSQINFSPACEITKEFLVHNRREELFTLSVSAEVSYQTYNEELKIGIFTPHPHLHKEEIESLKIYDGVILANTGLGHLGICEFDEISKSNEENYRALQELCSTIPVCVALQSVFGRVNLNVYTPGRKLLELGVLGNYSTLTYETQFIKLAYVLSKYSNNREEITNELWMSNLEGFDSSRLVD